MKKQEMKKARLCMKDGKRWKNNNRLSNKTLLAGMEKSDVFHQKKRSSNTSKI